MSRCLLLSNRLPVQYDEKTNSFVPSSGGLVSAIKGINPESVGHDFEWMGILTEDIDPEQIAGSMKFHPIQVPKEIYNSYYNNFCNNVIWPLFHYERSLVHHCPQGWADYKKVNEIIADAVLAEASEDDIIWIHDFHLMLVPGLVKEKNPDLKIGFFLHIPFPSSEIFRELPQREEILHSLIKCDLLGFHDLSYLNHFKMSVTRILGMSADTERKFGVYPISIDTPHFENLARSEKTQDQLSYYLTTKGDKKWILGIDRLDYIKGLVLKLQAYREYLTRNPDMIGKIQLVQVVIPSRTDVQEYKNLKEKIEQLVSSINGEFGSPVYMPVHYLYHSVNENELSALYQASEVMFISSQRDGMNLVCLEYVASQTPDSAGTVLLSEFAGAHSTLSYAHSINPWDIEGTAAAIKKALDTPQELSALRMQYMQNFLKNYTASDWAQFYLRDLTSESKPVRTNYPVTSEGFFSWMKLLRNKKILFFCDLDGTLLPIASHPSTVVMREKTARILAEMAHNPNLEFVVVSGRDKDFLSKQFSDLNFSMGACHGAYSFKNGKWESLINGENTAWRDTVLDIFRMYSIRTPGSLVEDKGFAITWHYRNSPQAFAEFLANKLFFELEATLASSPVQVIRGKKVIEVKSIHANKGAFVDHWIKSLEEKPEVIIALGDDTTDEDMFRTLQAQTAIPAYCIKVGSEQTEARYFIEDQVSVDPLMERMLESLGGGRGTHLEQ